MKLTNEQIQHIENYINKKGLNYIDLKDEVLDHIVLDIEHQLKKENITFNQAFEKVKAKWKKSFKADISFWLSTSNKAPMLLLSKSVKYYKSLYNKLFYLGYILLIAVLLILKNTYSFDINKHLNPFKTEIKILFLLLSVLGLFLSFYGLKKIKNSNYKTSYSFLFKTQKWLPIVFCSLLFILTLYFNAINIFSVVFFYGVLVLMAMNYAFYKKHFKEVNLYQKLKTL